MAFIDNLAYGLFSLSIAGFLVLYLVTSVYMAYRRKQRDYGERVAAAFVPLLLIGGYMIISGAFGQFTWPLPSSYNILFYDPMVSFGIVLVSLALTIRYKVKYDYVGFLGLLVGVMTIFYGIQGYSIGLTKAPEALLGLYALFGLAGVFSYPVALIMERLPGLQKNPWIGWSLCFLIFWLAMFGASLLAGYIAIEAIPAHLISPP